jgi:CheY-like chemotaxis protein
VNRLQDLGYRVQSVSKPADLVKSAEHEKPLLILADVEPRPAEVCDAIARLKENSTTSHIPIIALSSGKNIAGQTAARNAGATLAVSDTAILAHLAQFLDQALQVD